VGDFGVKHPPLDDFHHFQTSLELLRLVTSSPTGTRHLGFDIDCDRPNRIMPLSLDGCIPKLLKSVVPESVKLKLCDSPMIYAPPVFGSTALHAPPPPRLLLRRLSPPNGRRLPPLPRQGH
jgi:hypothetical protein